MALSFNAQDAQAVTKRVKQNPAERFVPQITQAARRGESTVRVFAGAWSELAALEAEGFAVNSFFQENPPAGGAGTYQEFWDISWA